MDEDICQKIENTIYDRYDGMFYVANHGYYLWIYRESDQKMIMVIHGYGTELEPYEVKLIKVDEDNTVDKRFLSKRSMYSYIKNDLLDDLMMYEI